MNRLKSGLAAAAIAALSAAALALPATVSEGEWTLYS